ncbi:MAG: IMP dehydrogenase [Phycisphaera sp.]|nr:IMP dehydrogenase [Phycisphaera sp.]
MSIRVALNHKTEYRYDRPVQLGPQTIRLRPAPHARTPVVSYSLRVEPDEHFINWQQDPQSNYLARVVFPNKVRHLLVEVDLIAEMTVINPFDFFLEPEAETYPFEYASWLTREIAPFLRCIEKPGEAFERYLAKVDRREQRTVDFLVGLNGQLQKDIEYAIRMEPGVQPPEETLVSKRGSCRDSAWLLVQLLRHLGIAARFVSGYLIQLKPDVKSLDGPSGAPEDFTDLHAWTEAYLPGAGWVGLDPTSGLMAGEGHIPVAATPDPLSAAPISGTLDECETEFAHHMRVTRIHEDPRVTKPYTEDQWRQIERLGHDIDQRLHAEDIRLTMGGEPTFVSIDDMEGAEWNTAAVGPNKRKLAERLIRRLHAKFSPGGLLHFGQGKWYPGEQLPRWALTTYWRKDGQPIWSDPNLIASCEKTYDFDHDDAEQFIVALAERLDVSDRYAVPAFEDPIHFLSKEGRLPINVDPEDNNLEEPEERDRIRRVFERGLSNPVGYVLPIQPSWDHHRGERIWQSGLWMLRSRHIILLPGDSPIGLRLPLPSLPWVAPGDYPHVVPVDPMAPRGELPVPQRRQLSLVATRRDPRTDAQERYVVMRDRVRPSEVDPDRAPEPGESAAWVVRTALCVEVRDGRLHVFLPPLANIESFLDLIAAIEDTAAALEMPVIVEGDPPPHDHRVNHIKATPDPGVIEVNVHPAASWDELVNTTNTLYEEARQTRLGTEKFMLDGRHTGTGGGNHVVLGGPSPTDSPFLRRPQVLRSMLAYWLNHPSLSYLFSGTFIGPTSQAPRVDEARSDSVYELEIALDEVDRQLEHFGKCPPWMVDRIFRHLLTDLTGNTHRAEFCIDKLYSPDSTTGRLGLIEFRAFEMPPHARMSLTQQLLLRAMVARFWRESYTERPTRWGTQLHDRYMLPHFVWKDFSEVIEDMRRAGYPLETAWFAPHFEFRFPVYGRIEHQGIEVELRQAIEPWLVLGEEPGAGGTARYVDSSVERLQVKVDNLTDSRHIVTCNGRRVPLRPTGTQGQCVAGVKYRAWQPPSCLHPTIGVDTPLVFDIVDTWNSRSIGGCSYHVAHPGGRNYDTFPVNAMEAEARRTARFFPYGHTPGPMQVPSPEPNPEFPHTLDLRRQPRGV